MISKNVKQKVEDYIHYHQKMMIDDSRMMERLVECRNYAFSLQTKNDIIMNTIFRSTLNFVRLKLADALKDYELD